MTELEHGRDLPSEERQDAAALSQKVYQYVLKQIVEVKMAPDSRVNTARIAELLGVSRTPIRSAMEQLIRDGLVKQVSDRGYQVASLSLADSLALCEARKILEGTAAYMAANNIKSPETAILEESVERAKDCFARKAFDEFTEQDEIFHKTILQAADNRYLLRAYDAIYVRSRRYRYISFTYCGETAEQNVSNAVAKHICILRAIKNRYSTVARNEMEEHIAYTYRTLFDLGHIIT